MRDTDQMIIKIKMCLFGKWTIFCMKTLVILFVFDYVMCHNKVVDTAHVFFSFTLENYM